MCESNTVVGAYTTYRHLQQYCSHPSICIFKSRICKENTCFKKNRIGTNEFGFSIILVNIRGKGQSMKVTNITLHFLHCFSKLFNQAS